MLNKAAFLTTAVTFEWIEWQNNASILRFPRHLFTIDVALKFVDVNCQMDSKDSSCSYKSKPDDI